jgi:hypothetical protein
MFAERNAKTTSASMTIGALIHAARRADRPDDQRAARAKLAELGIDPNAPTPPSAA